ncbi:MAG: ABC transporter ATP-binding protein [Candidatus Firestonebacteria bacterium]|nr:ABC transporter ATP-binding protein [Candidatus Firestonebacteria bacterium]
MNDDTLIFVENISKSYKSGEIETVILEKTSFKIKKGEFVVLLGVSGSGKTTLLNLIGAMDSPTSGSIIIDKFDITSLSQELLTDFRRDKIGFIFQFYNLLPTLTALENIQCGLEILPSLSSSEIKQISLEYLEIVGLKDKKDKFPAQLSGGEQQRVAVARALAKKPVLILADEPTGNLDEHTGEKIIKIMRDLNKETSTTFMIVTHNQKIAEVASRVLRIHEGKII